MYVAVKQLTVKVKELLIIAVNLITNINKLMTDKLDCQILQELQEGIDLKRRPFDGLAQKLQISCAQLLQRIDKLTAEGIIRRIGGSFDSQSSSCDIRWI